MHRRLNLKLVGSLFVVLSALVVSGAVALTAGWLMARRCATAVQEAATRETDALVDDIEERITSVARDLVIAPAEQELGELVRFRAELEIAAGRGRLT